MAIGKSMGLSSEHSRKNSILAQYWETNAGSSSPDMVWDALKHMCGGNMFQLVKKQKANTQVQQRQIELQEEIH